MNNPPAFPLAATEETNFSNQGMTLRDYFAAAAMQGFWANDTETGAYEHIAVVAYEQADAMLKAREK